MVFVGMEQTPLTSQGTVPLVPWVDVVSIVGVTL